LPETDDNRRLRVKDFLLRKEDGNGVGQGGK